MVLGLTSVSLVLLLLLLLLIKLLLINNNYTLMNPFFFIIKKFFFYPLNKEPTVFELWKLQMKTDRVCVYDVGS